jgi:hypothetical protein
LKKGGIIKQNKFKTDFDSPKTFAIIPFAIASLFYLSGCTLHALEYAEKKATANHNYMKIIKVRTATKQETGDISVCVDLVDIAEIKEPECYTVVLPVSTLAKDAADKIVNGFVDASDTSELYMYDLYSYPSNLKFYLYPLDKAQKKCENVSSDKSSIAESPVPIEEVTVPIVNHLAESDSFDKVLEKKLSQEEKLYAVRLVSAEQGTGIAPESHELINEKAEEVLNIHLIYWPPQVRQKQERIDPIGFAGGYQIDEGTDLYYLFVPFAVPIDALIGVLVVVASPYLLAYAIGYAIGYITHDASGD